MNKNLNPLNWTKKQQVVSGAIAILLVGGVTTGVVNANQKAEEKKVEQLAKEKTEKAEARAEKVKQAEKSNEADSKKLLDVAEKTPTDKNIKLAEDSILKVKNAEVKKAFDNQIVGIKNRVKLENTAKTAVSNYQKDAMNNDKYKIAQQAISKLTSSYSKGLKDTLSKQLTTSKKQADEATKAKQAKNDSKETDTNKKMSDSTGDTNDTSNNVSNDSQNTVENGGASASNSYGGDSQNNYLQGNSNTFQNNSNSNNQGNSGQGNSNSNSNTNTGSNGSNSNNNGSNSGGNTGQPSHTTKYLGWVSVDGVRKYTKLCNTVAEAWSFVDSTKNSSEVINLGFDGHSISYGTDTIEV